MAEELPKKKLKVLSTKEVNRGTNNSGEWVLSEVEAENEKGINVEAKLNTFADLTEHLNKVVNYAVKESTSSQGERVFTLYPPRKRGANLGPKVDEIRENLAALREEFDQLRDDVMKGDGSHEEFDSFREEVRGRLDELEKGPDF